MANPEFPIVTAVKKKRRSAYLLVASLIILAIGLTGLATMTALNKVAVDNVTANLEELCEDGAIDCSGSTGLPGSKGVPGTGIRDIQCVQGRFRFILTNGSRDIVGDCVANTGPQGPRGKQGVRGPRGFTGHQGPQGNRGPRGPKGRRGEPGKFELPGPLATLVEPLASSRIS